VSELWGTEFKDQVLKRNGRLVIRPDSGDPVQTLLKVFEILFGKFGFAVNSKGFKVLPEQVRVIQGDGIDYDSIKLIYDALVKNKISAENLVLGMGGALLQKVNRDTQKFALKCSYAEVNGEQVDVRKSPIELDSNGKITPSFKTSKAGRVTYLKDGKDMLETVFENGYVKKSYTFEDIRKRASPGGKAHDL
jgi:nicotinamide phosphoribosyltransferase